MKRPSGVLVHRSTKSLIRLTLLVCVATVGALAVPARASADRPNIEHVTVSRDGEGRLSFRIDFAGSVIIGYTDHVQVAIDSDRDPGTGVDGLDYSLDWSLLDDEDSFTLLTAVDGEPVESNPSGLQFSRTTASGTQGFGSFSVVFSVPASTIGSPRRFDFYVFVRADGMLDEAPSHLFFSAGTSPWTIQSTANQTRTHTPLRPTRTDPTSP